MNVCVAGAQGDQLMIWMGSTNYIFLPKAAQ